MITKLRSFQYRLYNRIYPYSASVTRQLSLWYFKLPKGSLYAWACWFLLGYSMALDYYLFRRVYCKDVVFVPFEVDENSFG